MKKLEVTITVKDLDEAKKRISINEDIIGRGNWESNIYFSSVFNTEDGDEKELFEDIKANYLTKILEGLEYTMNEAEATPIYGKLVTVKEFEISNKGYWM